jgi:hypothetical protein
MSVLGFSFLVLPVSALCESAPTTKDQSRGNSRTTTALTSAKAALVTPIPGASVTMTVSVNAGVLHSPRMA